MTDRIAPLPASALKWHCPPESLGFTSTAELEPLISIDGSRRWIEAMEFGIAV